MRKPPARPRALLADRLLRPLLVCALSACAPRPGQAAAPSAGPAGGAPAAASPAAAGPSGSCPVRLRQDRQILARAGGRLGFAVEAAPTCRWRVSALADWIKIEGPKEGRGPAEVRANAAANAGPDRLAVIAVGGERHVVVQRGTGPRTDHPRLWIRAEDLPRLRRWATPANPLWKEVIAPRVEEARRAYDQRFFPGGRPAARWPDPATGVDGPPTETVALQLAFHALVAPDAAARADSARRARALLMHVMEEIARGGPATGFRDERFPVGDRFRYTGEQWALLVDWLYPQLTRQDRATIRKVFLVWAEKQAQHSEHFRDRKLRADPGLTRNRVETRWAANNWQTAMVRNFLLESLALDDADDPPREADKDPLAPGNSLRAYRDEALRSAMVQQHFIFKEGGDAAGGIPPEGAFAYGAEASAFFFQGLLGLLSAGFVDWERLGAPVTLVADRYLRDVVAYFAHGIAPVPDSRQGERVYPAATLEQTREWAVVGYLPVAQLAAAGLLGALGGDASLRDRARWLLAETLPGGPERRFHHLRGDTTPAVLAFLLFDPGLPPPADFRGELGSFFEARPMGRLSARTSFRADARWLHYTCTWKTIDHQIDLCGSFIFWRKGDFITDPRNGYSDSGLLDAPDYHNAFAIEHRRPALADFEKLVWARGGQTRYNQGEPRTLASDRPEALMVESDATALHNQTDKPPEVEHASRVLVWIKPDALLVYDRARTVEAGRWKRFWLNLPSAPRISGPTVEARSRGGQEIRLDTLLPTRAQVRERPWEADPGIGSYEPMVAHVSVEDASDATPADLRMLHALQVGDPGRKPRPARLLTLEGKDAAAFHAAQLDGGSGEAAVLFSVAPGPRAAVELGHADPGLRLLVVTGLVPGERYDVARAAGRTTLRPGRTHLVDAAGALVVPLR